MKRRTAPLFVVGAVAVAIVLRYGMTKALMVQADGPLVIKAIRSPNGQKSIELVVYDTENTDGTHTFGVKGTTLQFTGAPWSTKPSELVQWVDDERYLVNGQVLVNQSTLETSDPLMLPCSYVTLSTALSPDRMVLAAEILNQESKTIEVWLSKFDGNPNKVFSAPVSTRFGEAYACAHWAGADTLYFDYWDDKTGYVYEWTPSAEPVAVLSGASRPIPSPDGRFLGVVLWNDDGHPASGAILDARTMEIIKCDLPEGWLTWLAQDRFSVHFGNMVSVGSMAGDAPFIAREMKGRVVDIEDDPAGISVTALTSTWTNGRSIISGLSETVISTK